MPKYANIGRMDARIDKYERRNEVIKPIPIPIPKPKPKELLQRIMIIMDSRFSTDANKYVQLLVSSASVINNIDIYTGPSKEITIENIKINNLSELLQFFYNKGYRMFIITNTSSVTYSAFNWIKTHDVVVFNPASTVATNEFLNNIPVNLIRTAVNDSNMLRYIFKTIIPDFAKFANTNDETLFLPLSKTEPDTSPFSIIIYIYEPSFYTSGYLDNLEKINKTLQLVSIKIENGVLPDLAKYYLTYNNISNAKYKDSLDKPLIIFNTDNPDSLLQYLDDPKYYDNYTFFGDFFSGITFKSKYAFTYAFVNIANFSSIGYRLSYLVDKEQLIDPLILNIYNTLSQSATIFMSVINKNKYTFNYIEFINLLNKYFITTNMEWSEKYVNIYRIRSTLPLNSLLFENKLELFLSYHTYNPNTVVVYSASSSVLNYNSLDIQDNLNTHPENIQRIEKMKPNIDNLLDDVVEYYISKSNIDIYIDFLEDNSKNKLSNRMFTEYYIYKSTLDYGIPIIVPEDINISKTISKDKYVLAPGETNSNLEISIQIPSAVYDTKVYFYDTITREIIHILTDNYLQETYDAIDISLEDSSPNIILHLYKGNLLNIGTYNENTNIFTTEEKIRGYISQNIIIDWLIIETEYEIGDSIIVKESCRNGTVTGVSDDKYTITALLEDDTTDTTYTQPQITKIVDI